MAEGIIGGILADDDEKPEVKATEALAGADAFAAAVAARLYASDPEVAKKTAAFLDEQSHLVKVQAKHPEDERAARLHYLQGQACEVDIRRFELRLRVGFQLFLVLVLAPVLVLLFVLLALGHPPAAMAYAKMHALVGHWVAKLLLFATIALFLWHAAHRLRVTLHHLGVRQDPNVAIVFYTIAAAGSVLSVWYQLRI